VAFYEKASALSQILLVEEDPDMPKVVFYAEILLEQIVFFNFFCLLIRFDNWIKRVRAIAKELSGIDCMIYSEGGKRPVIIEDDEDDEDDDDEDDDDEDDEDDDEDDEDDDDEDDDDDDDDEDDEDDDEDDKNNTKKRRTTP